MIHTKVKNVGIGKSGYLSISTTGPLSSTSFHSLPPSCSLSHLSRDGPDNILTTERISEIFLLLSHPLTLPPSLPPSLTHSLCPPLSLLVSTKWSPGARKQSTLSVLLEARSLKSVLSIYLSEGEIADRFRLLVTLSTWALLLLIVLYLTYTQSTWIDFRE